MKNLCILDHKMNRKEILIDSNFKNLDIQIPIQNILRGKFISKSRNENKKIFTHPVRNEEFL